MRTLHMLHTLDVDVHKLGSTVRNGFKWADLKYGEDIELCVCTRAPETHDVQGIGTVVDLWFGRMGHIPARLLAYEHEVRSREFTGLMDSMRKAYGEDIDVQSPVTVILYERVA